MSALILESERLLLREFTEDDTDFILQLVNSKDWIRYIGDRNIKTTNQAMDYLKAGPIKSYRENGFGLWLVELKTIGKAVGMCGLIKRDYLANIDIGFAFLPEHTGKGYAYEIAIKTVQFGFHQMQQEKLAAVTLPGNYRSIQLLEKIGFKFEMTVLSKETNEKLLLFGISKNTKYHDMENE